MRFSKSWALVAVAGVCCLSLRGELQQWVQWMPAGALQAVFFRTVAMPGGMVNSRRPPAETRPALSDRIFDEPNQAELYRLRAHEDELQLDFVAAEADWRKYAQVAGGNEALADYFHRRLQPKEELAALELVTKTPSERWTAVNEQAAWRAFERILNVCVEQGFPEAEAYREWIARYAQEPLVRQRYIGFLISKELYDDAGAQIAAYAQLFPNDVAYPVSARASIEVKRGSADQAIAIYDKAFQALWPDDVMAAYFKLLEDEGKLRDFLGRNRTAIAANAEDLEAATRLFAYYQHQQNPAAAARVLIEFRLNKESRHVAWKSAELSTLAQLFEKAGDANESARCYYALYSLPAPNDATEQAIAGLAALLLNHPDQQIRFGSGDLSFYKDIATMDSSPGFLNGILSLVMNGTTPGWKYQAQDLKAAVYFHRASAAELLGMLDKRFPQSASRDPLHARLIEAYSQYGEDEAVVRAGNEHLAAFPTSGRRLEVALLVADALARLGRNTEEYALYDQLLKELAAKADGVPLGKKSAVRQPEYQQVLERYVSRLSANREPMNVLKLYRREIDRNPDDTGLYERLAGFLEGDNMFRDADQVYRQAIQKLNDKSFYASLGRSYIRRKETAAITSLTREVSEIFSGSELESYFGEVVAAAPLDSVLYRQVNLYAHKRFPDDLVFVRNLLEVYQRRETTDNVAYTNLLRNYWFYDPLLKNIFFEALSQQNQLTAELDVVRKASGSPAAQMFLAEGEAWQSHFEASAPLFQKIATAFPGDNELNERAASVHRSLATQDSTQSASQTAMAVKLEQNVVQADPRDRDALARVGDIYMDHDRFEEASPYWARMATLEPGRSAGVLEAATVFWDYYHFDEALRLINKGRRDFQSAALFAYQAGAIDEGKRDYEPAVREYVSGALAGDTTAEQRLMRLARRPSLRGPIDRATSFPKSPKAFNLRIEVLNAQSRRDDLKTVLADAVATSSDLPVLTRVDEESRKQGFDDVVRASMEREIEISGDPVEKMQLRMALARYYEGKNNVSAARSTIEALYHDNPKILGVVRAMVDFYIRAKQPEKAVATLLMAAKTASRGLQREFTMEAARKAEESGEYDESRSILAGVLQSDPNAADALALMGATYSASGDDARLKQFSLDSIAALKRAPLTSEVRKGRIAELRRGLIPALTRQGDFAGAVNQYIEVIDQYPEDAGLTDQATAYAIQYLGSAQQLLAFYRKTIGDAPRDYRWPIVLARIETHAEDYPAAIAAYTKALEDRPDRRDVLEARAHLEERLMRFDEAEASFRRLYELSYHDPQWMLKAGEICARQGKTQQAVAAVHQAIVGTGSETADDLFAIAAKLEAWELIPEAAGFADRGAKMAGDDLYQNPKYNQGAAEYLRLETRMRRYHAPYRRMLATASDQWAGDASIQAMGQAAAGYFTPEEKAALAHFLEARWGARKSLERRKFLLPLATAAGLQDLRARWLFEQEKPELDEVQIHRGRYEELGGQMEALAKHHAGEAAMKISPLLQTAVLAYHLEGDDASELRALDELNAVSRMQGEPFERFLTLLSKANPERIVELARDGFDAAADFAERQGDAVFAQRTLSALGGTRKPIWLKAYTALTGVYYSQNTPPVRQAFVSALGDGTVGERVGKPLDRDEQLAGNVWFYYGSSYGEYLAAHREPAAQDFLPASTEAAPGNADAYFQLGDYYQGVSQRARAITEFEQVLQLRPDSGMADDRIAECLWDQGRHADAVARWRAALAKMQRLETRGVAVPPEFWQTTTEMILNIGKHKVLPQLQPAIRNLLVEYMNRNQSYRLEPLLDAAVNASLDSGQDIGWVIEMASQSADAEGALSAFETVPRLTAAQQESVGRHLISIAERKLAGTHGEEIGRAVSDRDQKRLALVRLLQDHQKASAAQAEWDLLSRDAQRGAADTEMRLAAKTGNVPALIARYQKQPEDAPPLQAVLEAAASLKKAGDKASTVLFLEFAYSRELDALRYDESNFLGLATVRLEQGNTDAALALLHRMNLIAGEHFETFIPAADLLIQFGKKQAALPFLEARAKAVPWDAATQLRLGDFVSLVGNNQVPYAIRLQAAQSIGKPIVARSGELDAIAADKLTAMTAEHPYYVRARTLAAERTSNGTVKFRLLREALAIDPESAEIRRSLGVAAMVQRKDQFGISVLEPLLAQPDHLQIAVELSAAEERLGHSDRALQFTQRALQSEPSIAQQGLLAATKKRLQAVLNLRADNDARRPEIHEPLEQNHPVRPRRIR